MGMPGRWLWGCALALACSITALDLAAEQSTAEKARDVIQASGRSAGILVIAGLSDVSLGAELSRRTDFLVHGLALNEEALERLRQVGGPSAEGSAVFLDALREKQLPYADNLINVLVVSDLPGLAKCGIGLEELLRVVAPEGCLAIEGTSAEEVNGKLAPKGSATCKQVGRLAVLVKPWPAGMDVWSHPWHSASGNRASSDTLVEAAQGVRWMAGPVWPKRDQGGACRAVVTHRGRIFYLTQCSLESLSHTEDAASWYLVARDAFNGMFLWQHTYTPFKQGLAQSMEHLLVADGDRIYLGNAQSKKEAMEVLDAATGKVLSTFRMPVGAQKILIDGGRLIVFCRSNGVHALDPTTGKSLWAGPSSSDCVMGGGGIFCLEKGQVTRLDPGDGRRTWTTALSTLDASEGGARPAGSWRLHLVHAGLVLLSEGGSLAKNQYRGSLHALAAEDGKKRWTFPIPASTYESRNGIEAFAVNQKIWTFIGGEKKGAGHPVLYALDPLTGKLQQTIQTPGALSPGCGQLTATPRFFLGIRPVVSMFEVKSERDFPFRAARGSCKQPIVPANGLVYVAPNTCICSNAVVGASLRGFLALAGSSAARPPSDAPRRIAAPNGKLTSKAAEDDWPTLRGGPERSGRAAASIPADSELLWQRPLARRRETGTLSKDWNTNTWLGDPISGPVVAGGLIFVTLPNEHAVVALRASDGSPQWRFTAGGTVDSPPTIQDGLCVFGCRDGWVYCLRAEDGKGVWRYRVAPRDVRIAAFGNLESPWPVSGSLLVQQGTVCAVAGQSTESDGGAHVAALKLTTGELVWERQLPPEGELEGVVHSVMVGDGESAFLGPWGFRLASGDPAKGEVLLPGVRGLLDGAWRRLPTSTRGKMHQWEFKRNKSLYLVYDGARAYNYLSEMTDKENTWTKVLSSKIVAQKRGAELEANPAWKLELPAPAQVEAMILSDKLLVLAGTEDFVGHQGAFVSLVSTDTGKVLKKFSIDAPPAWEGMAAAGGRLFISGIDGVLRCYGKR